MNTIFKSFFLIPALLQISARGVRRDGDCDVEAEPSLGYHEFHFVQMRDSWLPPKPSRLLSVRHTQQFQIQMHMVWRYVHVSRPVSQVGSPNVQMSQT